MPKARYRLQALLNIKQRVKDKAESALAAAIKRLVEAREKLKKLQKEKEEIIKKWEESRKKMVREFGEGSMIGEGNVHINYMRKLKEDEEEKQEEIEDQEDVIKEAEEGVKSARRDYIDACKELRMMEKHKKLWEKKEKTKITKREEKEMDELGNTIHQLRRMRGEKALNEI